MKIYNAIIMIDFNSIPIFISFISGSTLLTNKPFSLFTISTRKNANKGKLSPVKFNQMRLIPNQTRSPPINKDVDVPILSFP